MCLMADRRKLLKFLKPVRFTLRPIKAYKVLCYNKDYLVKRLKTPYRCEYVNVSDTHKATGDEQWDLNPYNNNFWLLSGGFIHCYKDMVDAIDNPPIKLDGYEYEVWEVEIPRFTRYVVSSDAAVFMHIAAKRINYIQKIL